MNWLRLQKAWRHRVWLPFLQRFHPEVELNAMGKRMRVDLRDGVIGRMLFLGESYEAELQNLMGHLELKGSVALDIGANIGLHALALSDLVGKAGKVFAFEPEAHNFELLEENVRLNGTANVVVRRAAVSDREGTCRLALNLCNHADHRVLTRSRSGVEEQESPVTTIDGCLPDLPADSIRFAKIDVQGHECQVLAGMRKTLERNPDLVLALEVYPDGLKETGHSASELMGLVQDLGFRGWELQPARILPISPPWAYDFMRPGHYVDVVLSRRPERLRKALSKIYQRELPS